MAPPLRCRPVMAAQVRTTAGPSASVVSPPRSATPRRCQSSRVHRHSIAPSGRNSRSGLSPAPMPAAYGKSHRRYLPGERRIHPLRIHVPHRRRADDSQRHVLDAVPVGVERRRARRPRERHPQSCGDALTAALVSGPAHGTVTTVAGRGVLVSAVSRFTGADTFTYRALNRQEPHDRHRLGCRAATHGRPGASRLFAWSIAGNGVTLALDATLDRTAAHGLCARRRRSAR